MSPTLRARVEAPPPSLLKRYREVAAVLIKYGFTDVVDALHLGSYLSLARRVTGRRPAEGGVTSKAVRLRQAFEELGPTFVKFGQALSLRGDVLPPELTHELARLQDAVAPLPPGTAEAAVSEAFGRPATSVFARFDPAPLASASIAQVHRAELLTGESVVVKVRRPGIDRTIASDLDVLRQLARLLDRRFPPAAVADPINLVEEFARTIQGELDLAREGRSLDRCARNFAGDASVRVPRVFWPMTTSAVLTMERFEGLKVSELDASGLDGESRRSLARRGADMMLTQILVHGFFHADPHPGNLMVLSDGAIGLLDFGIVGRLDPGMRRTLAQAIRAVATGNVERLATIVCDVTAPRVEVDRRILEDDLRHLLDRYGDVPVGDLSMRDVLGDLVRVASRHHLRFPSNLLLLIKAVVTIEGVGRIVDPSFKMVEHAAPMVERLWRREHTPRAMATRARASVFDLAFALRALPKQLEGLSRKMRDGRLEVQFVHRNLDHFITEMDRSSNRLSFAIVIAAIVIGSSLVIQAGAGAASPAYTRLGLVGFLVAAVLGIGLVIGVVRSGRL